MVCLEPGVVVGYVQNNPRDRESQGQARAKVEHPFRGITRQFGYTKVRLRALTKNTAQMVTLLALSNLWMARRHLLTTTGELRL